VKRLTSATVRKNLWISKLSIAIIGAGIPSRTIAAVFASRGGKATSPAKQSSAQANGRKGGRPKRAAKTEAA
jgi:hypothetical protein